MKLKKFAASSFILIMAAGSLFAQQKQKDQFVSNYQSQKLFVVTLNKHRKTPKQVVL